MTDLILPIARRFRGFLPVVIDVETGGFNARTDALLEVAAILIGMDDKGRLHPAEQFFFNVEPFQGANIEAAALEFTGIKPDNPLRGAVPEKDALTAIFSATRAEVKRTGCQRAVVVAHNASFDQGFLNEAAGRSNLKRNPFHPFSSFDTASLAGLVYGQTVLARACAAAGIAFNNQEAHSALYDCEKTAELFCDMVNRWPNPVDLSAPSLPESED
ncbi:MAG: ribonuclease T [Pseudomonadales bacterium]